MTVNQCADPIIEPQATALMMARWVHNRARAVRTYLFGSRARGDHYPVWWTRLVGQNQGGVK